MKYIFILLIVLSSCASASMSIPVKLEFLSLRPSQGNPGVFEAQYEACIAKFLGICTKKKMEKFLIDTKDPKQHQMIIDKNMVLKVREKF